MSHNVIIQIVVRNDFDCGDWLLYVVRIHAFSMSAGRCLMENIDDVSSGGNGTRLLHWIRECLPDL